MGRGLLIQLIHHCILPGADNRQEIPLAMPAAAGDGKGPPQGQLPQIQGQFKRAPGC